ncbi:ATP-binding protein [Streptomyces sp. SAT1]|uniref:NACHT domain-containing protein n=1 Tax=Streptomyces sp. SAT1 TaxID=1849967 RepID=UPI0007DDD3DC|nr:NACHT domain-containing protein [Streptomyces sp. SAT1]ANH92734.1 ATP-binding protein [Streptomyces sp. SAT1]
MEPMALGGRLASGLIAPLVKKLFVADGPGAALVDRPVRMSDLVSFRGEKRSLGEKEVRELAGRLVGGAADPPGEPPFPPGEQDAVTDALAARLLALGDLGMDDVQAVRLGHRELARRLSGAAPAAHGLSADAAYFLDSATEGACLHILEFFTRRSTFVARTLVEQTRTQSELIARIDELIVRTPRPDARDTAFERRYLPHLAQRHNHITIYGIDLRDSPDRWPLEVAYLSLEATGAREDTPDPAPEDHAVTDAARLPAEEALRADPRVLLRGDAGSGKTTLVQWLAVTAARDGDRVPFVLPLRTLVRTGPLPAPAGFLKAAGCPLTEPEGWAERVLTAGRALLLVDGLDEIPAADRHRTRDWLGALLAAYPGNQWLLTSRPTAVRPDWLAQEGFRELTLTPMRDTEVATFVHRWHQAACAPEYAGALIDSLRTKRDLARLATNPLMCGLICALHRERRGYLPTGRKELYDAALAMLLTRRDRERGLPGTDEVDLGEEAALELLQRLAYALVLSGRTEMDTETAEGIVERRLPSLALPAGPATASAVLRTLLLRSGLLRRPAEGAVDFVHRTFQDYLGARHAVEEGHLDLLADRAHETQWEDVVRMAVAHARPRERASVLRRLLARDTPRLALLALACLEHTPALEPAVRAEVEARTAALIPPRTPEDAKALAEAGPLVLELLPGPEGLTDAEALGVTVTASVLGADEPAGALGVLRRFRSHPDLGVRRQLVGTWRRFGTEEYAAEVLDHLDRDDLLITCETDAQRAALARMRPWRRVTFRGAHPAAEMASAVPGRDGVRLLDLCDNPLVGDLGALLPFSGLDGLWLRGCGWAHGLDRLAPLPLTDLAFGEIAELSGLAALRSLRRLSLDQLLPDGDLTGVLPTGAPLEHLHLGTIALMRAHALRGLRAWPTLTSLSLGDPHEFTGADWREVAALPALTSLVLRRLTLEHGLRTMPELPSVRDLRLTSRHDAHLLRVLAERLPHVRRVVFRSRWDYADQRELHTQLFPAAEITYLRS